MASYGWMFASSGDWSSSDNWKDVDLQTTGTAPTSADDAYIMGGAVVTVSAGESFQIQDLNLASYSLPGSDTIGSPEVLLQSGTLSIGDNVNDSFTVAGYVPSQYVPGGGEPPISVDGGGTIALSGGSNLWIGGNVGTDIDINFLDGANNTLTLGGFAAATNAVGGPINGFIPGDTIDLSGIPIAGAAETYDPTSQLLSVTSDGTLAASFTVAGTSAYNTYSSYNFDLTDDGSGNVDVSVTGPTFWVDDSTAGTSGYERGQILPGEPSYLYGGYFYYGSDNLVASATTPNVWLLGGSGVDCLVAQSGNNVLTGGGSSNFLVGGTGQDQFSVDAREGVTWDTVENFNAGDILVIWGWNANTTSFWTPNDGAPGYTGQTLHASITGDGTIDASVTFAGVSDVSHYVLSTGTLDGISYAQVFNPG